MVLRHCDSTSTWIDRLCDLISHRMTSVKPSVLDLRALSGLADPQNDTKSTGLLA